MGKILTVRVVPDLFLSSLKNRPKAKNGRADSSDDSPPSYEKSQRDSKLKPGAASWGRSIKRKSREKSAAQTGEPKFSPKRARSLARQRQVHVFEDSLRWSLRKERPNFNFAPASLPASPSPETPTFRSRAPSVVEPALEPDVTPTAEPVAAADAAVTAAAVTTAPQHFPHHHWTPAGITMMLLWGLMCAVVASPAHEAIKALWITGVVVGTCVRHMCLEVNYVEGQPYPWF